jgi:Mn2+/Fe2+ NRAMP family transporter
MIFVPVFAVFMWYVIERGNFKFVQNIFLTSCILFFCYIINGFIARPDIPAMIKGSFIPTLPMEKNFIFTATALIGTTLTVWGQIFIQSFFVDKGVDKRHIKSARIDVAFGAFWTDFIAYFIIISAASTMFVKGIRINNTLDAAVALGPLLGPMAKHLFAWGLLNASLLGACVISMSTAYIITEVLGVERRVNATFREAPIFYSIIGFCIFTSAILVFIPNFPIIAVFTASQALNTMILPVIFIILLRLINDKSLMGQYTNNMFANIITVVTIISFTVISLIMLYLMFF